MQKFTETKWHKIGKEGNQKSMFPWQSNKNFIKCHFDNDDKNFGNPNSNNKIENKILKNEPNVRHG